MARRIILILLTTDASAGFDQLGGVRAEVLSLP